MYALCMVSTQSAEQKIRIHAVYNIYGKRAWQKTSIVWNNNNEKLGLHKK